MKAAIYARMSTDKQSAASPEDQNDLELVEGSPACFVL